MTDLTSEEMLEVIHRGLDRNAARFRAAALRKQRASERTNLDLPATEDRAIPGKSELRSYWQTVAERALPYLGNRLLTLVRQIEGAVDYHRGPLPPIPPVVRHLKIVKGHGTNGIRVWVDDLAGLLGLVDMDVIEIHPWGSTIDDIERPDLLAFNLKPGDGVEWGFVVETAQRLRGILAEEELTCWPKTAGGDSLHVMVPVARKQGWEAARHFTKTVAERLASTVPERYTLSARSNRTGKILLDYMRNGRGSTVVGAYSPRAIAGFPVAAPISWRELEGERCIPRYTLDNPPPPASEA